MTTRRGFLGLFAGLPLAGAVRRDAPAVPPKAEIRKLLVNYEIDCSGADARVVERIKAALQEHQRAILKRGKGIA